MASLITSLPSLIFPYEADILQFSSTESVRVRLQANDDVILDVYLYPDESGVAELSDIASFLADRLTDAPTALYLQLDDDTATELCTVLPCRWEVAETAETFVSLSFLTPASSKLTHLSATEYLTWYDTDGTATEGSISAVWSVDDTSISTTKTGVTVESSTDNLRTLDVSPSTLTAPSDSARLVRYSVTVGKRTMTYIVAPDGMATGEITDVSFVNNFGQVDTFHFFGEVQRTLKPSFSSAVVSGKYRNYDVKAVPEWEAQTGPLPDDTLPLLDDLVTASSITRTADGCALAITECELKTSNTSDALNSYSVTWRETGRRKTLTPARAVRTFDETFDSTFF